MNPVNVTTTGLVLEVDGLSKSYQRRPVLQNVCFQVGRGERVAIMGRSGSGKSTLLNCLAGIDRPDAGQVMLAGEVVTGRAPADMARLRRKEVSTIFQFFHLLPTLTVFENVELPLQLLGIGNVERAQRSHELLEAVQLTHRKDALSTELSGGEMQRVAIARALIHRPRLILADEPTGNLDSKTGDAILSLVESLTEQYEMALLLVTHSKEATRICHRVLHMIDGRLEASADG
jgi:ABC-type lipoprotein export system ATPase subunit